MRPSAYLPDGYNLENAKSSGLDYDAEIASIFWSLNIPTEMLPEGGPREIPNKLEYCIDRIRKWDPRLYV